MALDKYKAEIDVIQKKWQPGIQKCLDRLTSLARMLKSDLNSRGFSRAESDAISSLPDEYDEDTVPKKSPIPLRDRERRGLKMYKAYMAERDTPKFKEELRILREQSDEPDMIVPSGILAGTDSLYYSIELLEFWHLCAQRQHEIDAVRSLRKINCSI